ncbi:MAG: preprotein translocase subunit SecG [Alphaproteobacteria bacterium]|nr:preprotein translocase subunit SecG [Alphaproteobacteria bacterium]
MYTVLLVTHTILVLFLIAIILLQRSGDDGLSGLSGGGGNLLSGRAAGNVLTRTTAILATLFICTSLALAIMSGHMRGRSILDSAPAETAPAPAAAPAPVPETMPSVPKPD